MLGFLSTILFVRTVFYLFDKKSASNTGFSSVLYFLAALVAITIAGIGLNVLQDFQNNKLDYNETEWTTMLGGIVVLSVMTYGMFKASFILKNTNPLIYNSLQEFQTFQAIVRANNFASGIFSIGIMINAIFAFFLFIGVMVYCILFLVTLGAIWWDKKAKIDDFIYIPNQFFNWEKNYFEFVGIDPGLIIVFVMSVLFVVPTFLAYWIVLREKILLKS